MPSVSSSFWLLSIVTAQLALAVYVVLFAASIKLHHHRREVQRNFKVPFGDVGIWTVAICGILICLAAIGIGFIKPSHIPTHSSIPYPLLILGSVLILSALPLPLYWISQSMRRKKKLLHK